MGQGSMADSGGVHKSYGQNNGQNVKSTRRGFEWTKVWTKGPTEVARNHHQSGGGSCGAAAAGQGSPPAAYFGGVWGPGKNSQKYNNYGTLKLRWRL